MPNVAANADADIINDAYAERLKDLFDIFFTSTVQTPDNPGPAKDAFVRGVMLARAVRDTAIAALPAEGTALPKPFNAIANT